MAEAIRYKGQASPEPRSINPEEGGIMVAVDNCGIISPPPYSIPSPGCFFCIMKVE